MIISKIIGKILPLILKEVFKAVMPELRPLQKYVNEPNELDDKVKELEKRLEKVEFSNNNKETKKDSMYASLKKEIQKIKNDSK